jgi:predicted phage tail protein
MRGANLEAHEIAEQLDEHAAPHHHGGEERDWFRRLTGIYVGFVAMLLAIASLGGAGATKEMLNANIHASDTYAFYQAKYLRQTDYQTAAEMLDWLATASSGLAPDARAKATALVKRYRDTAAHDESDPKKGNGKRELLAKAKEWESARDHAAAQVPNFEYSEALYQIAIVLGSVAIVAASPWLLGVSGILAAGGFLFMLNGLFLLVRFAAG